MKKYQVLLNKACFFEKKAEEERKIKQVFDFYYKKVEDAIKAANYRNPLSVIDYSYCNKLRLIMRNYGGNTLNLDLVNKGKELIKKV